MLRLMGAICLAGGCAWAGFQASAVLRGRVRALHAMEAGLLVLEQELELEAWSLPQLMERLEERSQGTAKAIFSGCRDGLDRLDQEDFSSLWRRLVLERRELGADGQDSLAPLGETLGRCDSQAQCRAVRAVRNRLKELQARAEEDSRSQGKVCQVLGLSGGAFLVILLL